ncbi:MAG: RNA polymerase factor sigma-54 [Zavarzinella sp.]
MKMGIDLSGQMIQTQRQVLSRLQIQAMKILQMPQVELDARIEKELEENPVIELRRAEVEDFGDAPAMDAMVAPDTPLKHDLSDPGASQEFERLDALDIDWGGYFNQEDAGPTRATGEERSDQKLDAMMNIQDRPISLHDHLFEQLPELNLNPQELLLVLHIISYIDPTGYVGKRDEQDQFQPVSLAEIVEQFNQRQTNPELESAEEEKYLATLSDAEGCLELIQMLDPPGVGARDLRECLLLQVPQEHPQYGLIQTIIQKHLEDIAHNRLPLVQKHTGASLEMIQAAIEFIQTLDPKPGNRFQHETTPYVLPDLIIEQNADGEYEVKIVNDWVPRLRIPKRYLDMARNPNNDEKTRTYLREKLNSAQWLRNAILKRRETLQKVTEAIVRHQRAFLDSGPDYIEPLRMQEIAEQVGVHVTTVSRAVDDKWVMTPKGMFPLKRFFVGAAKNKDTGESIPWEKVKAALTEMIQNEDKSNPLSDEELYHRLEKAGYPVKRRTITKYRKVLNIPSSRERRSWVESN